MVRAAAHGDARPEKRSRMRVEERWHAPPERLAHCEALPQLFPVFVRTLVELLCLPDDPADIEAIRVLHDLRGAAEAALSDWTALMGHTHAWQEATHALQQTSARFAALPEDYRTVEDWRDVEVMLWLSAALDRHQSADVASAPPLAASVLELSNAMDTAPEPWRTWLWAAASSLAATAPAAMCERLLDWMLHRPPWATFAPELLELTELPYAEGLEQLCRMLPAERAHVAVGERLALLAFAERPSIASHDGSVRAQSLMLQAMRNAMCCEPQLLCNGLAHSVLPALCQTVDIEAEAAPGDPDPAWHSAQVLFATLTAALPTAEAPSAELSHPAVALWKERWLYVEAALLRWPQSSATDQPVLAATQAITAAVAALPGLLPDALPLLVQSIRHHELPIVQLDALRAIANHVACPPADAVQAARFIADAISGSVESLLDRQKSLHESPGALAALFALLADALRLSPAGMTGAGPCNDQLRPQLLLKSVLLGRCLALVPIVLPDCASVPATTAMLRFMANLVSADEHATLQSTQRPIFAAILPELCASLCQALGALEHLAELDEGLVTAAEFLLCAAAALPDDLPGALTSGLHRAHLTSGSGDRLRKHISNRAAYIKMDEWLEELQHIVCELQRESRQVSH